MCCSSGTLVPHTLFDLSMDSSYVVKDWCEILQTLLVLYLKIFKYLLCNQQNRSLTSEVKN